VFTTVEVAMDAKYVIRRDLAGVDYDDAVERTVAALADEGFGVLTEIDVAATLKKKLDVDFRRYRILGACNPPLAHQALSHELFLGALLPCNVLVIDDEAGGSIVAAFKPSEGFQMVDNPDMGPVAQEVEERLERVLASL
jgi:uncharacterized protein (DUF302 family)